MPVDKKTRTESGAGDVDHLLPDGEWSHGGGENGWWGRYAFLCLAGRANAS